MLKQNSTRHKATRRIAIAVRLNRHPEQEFVAGILDYAHTSGNWDISIIQRAEDFTPAALEQLQRDGVDGLIATEEGIGGTEEALVHSQIPLVMVGTRENFIRNRKQDVVFLTVDETGIGKTAAEHLISLGNFKTYGTTYSSEDEYHVRLRLQGFAAGLAKIKAAPKECPADPKALENWLRAAMKPIALYGGDEAAKTVIEVARRINLKIPERLSVLGDGNYRLLDEAISPTLCSIDPGSREEGHVAARELDRLMRRRKPAPPVTRIVTAHRIIQRETTGPTAPSVHLIDNALAYIAENATTGISCPDVAAHLRVSRRLLDLRFSENLQRSVSDEIRKVRFEAVKRLLRTTRRPIALITRQCGFANSEYAKAAFKRRFGMTMGDYRSMSENR